MSEAGASRDVAPSRGTGPALVRDFAEVVAGGSEIVAATVTALVLRRWYNRWGATPAEAAAAMPGDELCPCPKMASTRAISIGAPPEEVWAWLVQIGQGRGGFYSFDALENLARCGIHSASEITGEFQELNAGDLIRLAPGQAPCYRVATVERPRVLVLVGADARTRAVPPRPVSAEQPATTWQWVLHPAEGGHGTRLVSRQRYSYARRQSVLWHVVEPVDFVMERRMLHGIKARAENRVMAGA